MWKRWMVGLLALLLLGGSTAYACDDRRGDEALHRHIAALCEEYGVPELLVHAVIDRESSWNAGAVNADGNCHGLMQIHEVNFGSLQRELGLSDLSDPYQNVEAGISMLSDYIARYLDYHMALMCYNCGEAGARKQWAQGQYESDYSRWVMDRMHDLEWEALSAAREKCRRDSAEA